MLLLGVGCGQEEAFRPEGLVLLVSESSPLWPGRTVEVRLENRGRQTVYARVRAASDPVGTLRIASGGDWTLERLVGERYESASLPVASSALQMTALEPGRTYVGFWTVPAPFPPPQRYRLCLKVYESAVLASRVRWTALCTEDILVQEPEHPER